MVEIFCGILGGSKYGNNVRRWGFAKDGSDPANLGQCFVAIDPECFAPGFSERLRLVETLYCTAYTYSEIIRKNRYDAVFGGTELPLGFPAVGYKKLLLLSGLFCSVQM